MAHRARQEHRQLVIVCRPRALGFGHAPFMVHAVDVEGAHVLVPPPPPYLTRMRALDAQRRARANDGAVRHDIVALVGCNAVPGPMTALFVMIVALRDCRPPCPHP